MDVLPIEFEGAAVERLRHSMQLRRQADIEEMRALAELAAEHSWTTTDELDVVGERAVRIGADGSALIGEYLPLEVAAIKAISVTAATWLIRDVLNLQGRHPALWLAVNKGVVQPYRAFQLAQLAAKYDLTLAEALQLDATLSPRFGRIGWPRLMRLARGLIAVVAADRIKTAADLARQARYVRSATSTDEPVITELWARLDTTDARQLEATVSALAKALGRLGDTDDLDIRRARALGILATPQRAIALLNGADDTRYLPRTKVYLHLSDATVTGDGGVIRAETLGPLVREQLTELFGTHRLTITPVLHVGHEMAVDNYEIPDRMLETIVLRDACEVFPYSSRAARGLDLDHTIPYERGTPEQTRSGNLGPLTRRVHRAKTANQWQVNQPCPGTFWWRSPRDQHYRVTPDGTTDLHDWSPAERFLQWSLDKSGLAAPSKY